MTNQELIDLVETFVAESALVGGPPMFSMFSHGDCVVSCVWSDSLYQALHGGPRDIRFKALIVCLQCGRRQHYGEQSVRLIQVGNGSEIVAAVRASLEGQ